MNTSPTPRLTHVASRHRRGTITVLAAFLSVVMLGMVAFSVDIGYILSSQQELQRTADSAALAACWELGLNTANGESEYTAMCAGRTAASHYAGSNYVGGGSPLVDPNLSNTDSGDVVFGRLEDLYAINPSIDTNSTEGFNAVTVRIRKNDDINGKIPLFFARVFGLTGQAIQGEATAAYALGVSGLKIPSSGANIDLLPFALDVDTWDDLMNGHASDDWNWDGETQTASSGSDGILEVNLYPQGTGSPGNRGTVDIGSSNNSTNDIARQIVSGISSADMDHHAGVLEFDDNGELELNGDTGISAGVKDELASIIGEPRIIPIFSRVHGPGNNAQYTIVRWAGIRIVDVKLTGPMNKKRLIVQPAPIVVEGVVPGGDDDSDYVYSPVVLVK